MQRFVSHSRAETVRFAANFVQKLPPGTVVAFLGGLGMGKTAFVEGMAQGLGLQCEVTSPTFAIVNEYRGQGTVLYHFDMYRVDSWDDLYTTGYFDCVQSGAYVAVEWSENIYGALEDDAVMVELERLGENDRRITIYRKGDGRLDSRD